MKVVWTARSADGLRGADIVAEDNVPQFQDRAIQGTLQGLGKLGLISTFLFTRETNSQTWVLAGNDIDALDDAVTAYRQSLGALQFASITLLGPTGIVRHRTAGGGNRFYLRYSSGVRQKVEGAVLLAQGLLAPDELPEVIPQPVKTFP
jgi:hypothetical protein